VGELARAAIGSNGLGGQLPTLNRRPPFEDIKVCYETYCGLRASIPARAHETTTLGTEVKESIQHRIVRLFRKILYAVSLMQNDSRFRYLTQWVATQN